MSQNPKMDFSASSVKTITKENDVLPVWDLDALFGYEGGYGGAAFEADFAKMSELTQDFIKDYKGKVKKLSGDELAEALGRKREIYGFEGKMGTYMQEKTTQHSRDNSPAAESYNKRVTLALNDLVFFNNEIKKISNTRMSAMLKESDALRVYEPALVSLRRYKPHTPPEEIQKYSAELGAAGIISGMYERRAAALRFELDGKTYNETGIVKIAYNDHDQDRRRRAQEVFEKVMGDNVDFHAEVHNALLHFKTVNDRWSKYKQPWDERHMRNNVPGSVVDALETAVKSSYERTSHRFYALKARLMGQEKLNTYDRNYNIFADTSDRYIPWEEGKKIVLDAFYSFDARAGKAAQRFFDEGWIDAKPRDFKGGGAHAHPGAAQLVHPVVMTNYLGKPGDVMTLAHELGHGIHQLMAAPKGDAIVSTPLTLAETASVFAEMLTFKSLMNTTQNEDERIALLFDKVNSMLNTVVRQISFYDFEKRIHTQFRENDSTPLTAGELSRHWNDVAKESLGPSIEIPDSYGPVFGCIPHIVRSQFYVYAYAFGDSFVNALYQSYENTNDKEAFKDKYFGMLEAGGTYTLDDAKKDYGLDIADPAFWNIGLDMIAGMVDELEAMVEKRDLKKAPASEVSDLDVPEV